MQFPGKAMTDVSETLNRDSDISKIIAVPFMLSSGLNCAKHPETGPGRRIAALPHQTSDITGLQRNKLHVSRAGADILGGNVTPAQTFDEAAVGAEHLLAIVGLVVANYNRLPAA